MAAVALQREGFPVSVARSLHEARESIRKSTAELVILDRRLPDGDGLSFLSELKAQLPDAVVIMVTAYGDIASAVDAIRAGAADYLTKPVELADLVMKARRSAEQIHLRDRLQQVEAEISSRSRFTLPRSARPRPSLPTRAKTRSMGSRQRPAGSPPGPITSCPRERSSARSIQLRRPSRSDRRKRALRTRARGVHRRPNDAARPGGGGLGRDFVPRRDR